MATRDVAWILGKRLLEYAMRRWPSLSGSTIEAMGVAEGHLSIVPENQVRACNGGLLHGSC